MLIIKLPKELFEKIAEYIFHIEDIYYYQKAIPEVRSLYQKRLKIFTENYYKPIVDAFGGIDKLPTYELLPFQNRFIKVDYIDSIKVSDMKSNIMIGIDCCSRLFICLKYKENKEEKVITFFERYTYEYSTWTTGTCYNTCLSPYGYIYDRGIMKSTNILLEVKKIIENDFVYR